MAQLGPYVNNKFTRLIIKIKRIRLQNNLGSVLYKIDVLNATAYHTSGFSNCNSYSVILEVILQNSKKHKIQIDY